VDQGSTEHCAKQTDGRRHDQANHTGTARQAKLTQSDGGGQNEDHASEMPRKRFSTGLFYMGGRPTFVDY
jgi:hypothetical protein